MQRLLRVINFHVEDVLLAISPQRVWGPFSFLDARGIRHEFLTDPSRIVIP